MHHKARAKRMVDGQLVPLPKDDQEKLLREAMQVCIDGLHDEDTHIGKYLREVCSVFANVIHVSVNRQALEARLVRLEKRLKVPAKERHQCVGRLKKAPELKIIGERVWKHKGVALDKTSKVNNRAAVPVSVQMQGEEAVQKHLDQLKVDLDRYCTMKHTHGNSGQHQEGEMDRKVSLGRKLWRGRQCRDPCASPP